MDFYPIFFLLCPVICTMTDMTSSQVTELGNYLDGVIHTCRPAFLNPMMKHLEEMDGLDMEPDTKVLLMIAASSALGCPGTAECVTDEFSENYGNHSIPVNCTDMSDHDNVEDMSIEEHEAAKQQFYIILGTFLKDVKMSSNPKLSRSRSRTRTRTESNKMTSNSSKTLIKKLDTNPLFTRIVIKMLNKKTSLLPKDSRRQRRRKKKKTNFKVPESTPKNENFYIKSEIPEDITTSFEDKENTVEPENNTILNTTENEQIHISHILSIKNQNSTTTAISLMENTEDHSTTLKVIADSVVVLKNVSASSYDEPYNAAANSSYTFQTSNKSLHLITRTKRETIEEVKLQSFDEYVSCQIQLTPIATWLRAPLYKCIESCEEDDDCEALAHTDLGQEGDVCRFHGLTKEEAGPLFKCDPSYSDSTVYAKKVEEHAYVMTNQYSGLVMTAKNSYTVELSVFTGDDSQFWIWDKKTGIIGSKKFPQHYLTMFPSYGVYLLSFKIDGWQEFYSFDSGIGLTENELLTADTDGRHLTTNSKILSMREAWTVQDTIIPIILTNIKTGNVLQTRGETATEARPYTGEKNQEWVFDGVSLRSAEHPNRVLALANNKNSFDLETFGNTEKQRFALTENFLVPENCQNDFCLSWRIGLERDYFTISSKLTAKVVDAPNANSIHMHDYHGEDHQLWFWDGESIRSKKYPEKVLDLGILGMIYLNYYNGAENQKWRIEDNDLVSFYNDLRMGIYQGSESNGAKIGGYMKSSSMNQQWSFNLGERIFFTISTHLSAKVLEAPNAESTHIWEYHGQDHQLWFWDDECIRSKKYPQKVLDLHKGDYEKNLWGKVNLGYYNGGENQKWNIEEGRLVSLYKELRLTFFGAAVGVEQKTSGINQIWSFNFGHRLYFTISSYVNAKVLEASNSNQVHMWEYHGQDHQFWFLDGEFIRSKKYPDKLLDLHVIDYLRDGWGKIYLASYDGRDNQKWNVDGGKLVSSYKNLNMDIYQSSKSDGAKVGGYRNTGNMNQVWSFNFGDRIFFTISSYSNAKVLEAPNSNSVHMWDYHGQDHQLWFFDGELIRSKKYPEKVLYISVREYLKRFWGHIYLGSADGGENQRWQINGGELVSSYKGLKMNIYQGSRSNGAKVGGYYSQASYSNQLWSFNSGKRSFFTITSHLNSKALDAPNSNSIHMWSYHGKDHQLWFWDGDFIRSKKYPEKCIDLHKADFERYSWGRIYLSDCHGGENLKWKINEDELVSFYKDMRLDIYSRSNPKIGGYRRTNNNYQKWTFSGPSSGTSSCVNEVEQDIYSVVQWIPFISTLWDLGSSIGYAAAGCTSIAEERAVSLAIGAVMDIATVATLGTGTIAFQGAKQGIKLAVNIGIKEALKQGTKSMVKIGAKLVSKNLVKSVSKQGIKKALKTGTKFLWKNIVVDNFNVLKNAFKLTKTFVKNPMKTTLKLGQGLKATGEKIAELKELKSFNIKAWANGDYPLHKSLPMKADDVFRCKRGLGYCNIKKSNVITPEKDIKEKLKDLEVNLKSAEISKAYKESILTGTDFSAMKMPNNPPNELVQLKNRLIIQSRNNEVADEDLKMYLVYDYTVNSGAYNHMFRAARQDNLFTIPGHFRNTLDIDIERNTAFRSAVEKSHFIQKYLLDQPIALPPGPSKTVYRRLADYDQMESQYTSGQIIQLDTFVSTSKSSSIDMAQVGQASKLNVDMTIHTRSGRDISQLSKFPEQQEVLLPMHSQYKVTTFEKIPVLDASNNPVLDPTGKQKFKYKIELEEVPRFKITLDELETSVVSSNWPTFCCMM